MNTRAWWAGIEAYLHPTQREVSVFSVHFGTGQPCVALRSDKYHPEAYIYLSWPPAHVNVADWEPLMHREQLTEAEWRDLNRLMAETYCFTVSEALGLSHPSAARLATPASWTDGTDPTPKEEP